MAKITVKRWDFAELCFELFVRLNQECPAQGSLDEDGDLPSGTGRNCILGYVLFAGMPKEISISYNLYAGVPIPTTYAFSHFDSRSAVWPAFYAEASKFLSNLRKHIKVKAYLTFHAKILPEVWFPSKVEIIWHPCL